MHCQAAAPTSVLDPGQGCVVKPQLPAPGGAKRTGCSGHGHNERPSCRIWFQPPCLTGEETGTGSSEGSGHSGSCFLPVILPPGSVTLSLALVSPTICRSYGHQQH